MYKVKRFSKSLPVSAGTGAIVGGVLGRKYRYHRARKDAEESYDPKSDEEMYMRMYEMEKSRIGKSKYEDEYDVEATADSYKRKAEDIRNNPDKYRKLAGNRAVNNLRNDIHNGREDRLGKYEKRGMAIGGILGSGASLAKEVMIR